MSMPLTGVTWKPSDARCGVCGATQLAGFQAFAHDAPAGSMVRLMECQRCQFAWQFPFSRSARESSDIFSAAYVEGGGVASTYFDPAWRKQVAEIELEYMESLPLSGGHLLDVGGGDGTFALAAAQRGWAVTAVDPAIQPSRLAYPGLTVVRGTTEALPDQAIFDVVTLWDVIEHVEDPASLLESVRRRTALGGWLIVETGNYLSAERIRAGLTHWIYQLDHRWYFSPRSLSRLLETTGWQVRGFCPRVLRPGWNGNESYAGPTIRSLVSSCLRSPLRVRNHLLRHEHMKAASKWPQSGLEIICLAAQRID